MFIEYNEYVMMCYLLCEELFHHTLNFTYCIFRSFMCLRYLPINAFLWIALFVHLVTWSHWRVCTMDLVKYLEHCEIPQSGNVQCTRLSGTVWVPSQALSNGSAGTQTVRQVQGKGYLGQCGFGDSLATSSGLGCLGQCVYQDSWATSSGSGCLGQCGYQDSLATSSRSGCLGQCWFGDSLATSNGKVVGDSVGLETAWQHPMERLLETVLVWRQLGNIQ